MSSANVSAVIWTHCPNIKELSLNIVKEHDRQGREAVNTGRGLCYKPNVIRLHLIANSLGSEPD